MIRAYHDPALRHPISHDATWNGAVEFVCGKGRSRSRPIYIFNPESTAVLLKLEAQASGFIIDIPPSVSAVPGVTRLDVNVTSGALPQPVAVDFTITGTVNADETGESGFSELGYSDQAYTLESDRPTGALLKAEATAFCLPTADERFGDLGDTPVSTTSTFVDYIASGMGFVDDDYRNKMVELLADHTRDWGVWALNKHHMFDTGPMRHAKARADSIGYDPPGIPGLHPALRRRVYASAYQIARKHGSADGIRAVFIAMGIPQTQLKVWREGFTWFVRIPQWIAVAYDIDFLGTIALYHVDPYCIVNIAVNESTIDHEFADLDYTVEPGVAVQPPDTGTGTFLLLEDGTSYLLLEDGNRIELEQALDVVTYGPDTVTYLGDEVVY